ncbi:hypothetical protein INT46_011046 [Mucor plumbeus]|uniref:UBC core domain-containing protein n=1 Tax=Mucor plumbeus TaxID=97098 RepID=A0A8H7QJY1_9FUNG|nr:hypothetical protein INT46_011046 [Mucor plumbeus]
MTKGPYVSPSTGARKIGGLASSTRSPNVSNVFSHVRKVNKSAPLLQPHRLHRYSSSIAGEEWDDEDVNGTHTPYPVSEFYKKYELMTEFINLKNPNHCPLGLYIMPSSENFNVWYGVIFVHQGYYSSGAFKFRVAIPEAYPEYPPSVTFISDMFHPLIDSGGNLSLSQQFPTWRPYEDYIFHVLHYIKNIFKKAVLDRLIDKHCPQKEPYRLYRTDIKTFTKLAKQCAELSISESYLYDHFPEDNMIRFSPISESKYDIFKSQILKKANLSDSFEETVEKKQPQLEKAKTDEKFLKNLEIDVINVFDKMNMTKVSAIMNVDEDND